MSKRGRITLAPRDETGESQENETDGIPEPEQDTRDDYDAGADDATARRTPGTGSLLKIAFAGLATAALFLLLKNRKP